MQTCCRNTSGGATARLYFANRALVLMISQPLVPVGKSPVFAGLFEVRHGHQAESIVTRAGHIHVSIVNAAQGYSQVDRFPDTRRKRYGFMCSSA
jgi:hypothetical protein